MTPEERAVKLTPRGQPTDVGDPVSLELFRGKIAAEIRAAVEEANADELRIKLSTSNALVNQAKAEAYEDAAKIVYDNLLHALSQEEPAEKWLANLIRARAKELK